MTTNKILFAVATKAYERWLPEERNAVEDFLRAHDIDPTEVPVGSGNEIVVTRLDQSGEEWLSVWVNDGEDGRPVRCPHCPGCVKSKRVSRPLKTPPPRVRFASYAFVDAPPA